MKKINTVDINRLSRVFGRLVVRLSLPLAIFAACQNHDIIEKDSPAPPVSKTQMNDTVMVFNNQAEANANIGLLEKYIAAGKKVDCTINFPMGISAAELNDNSDWRTNPKVSLGFGSNGFMFALEPGIALSQETHKKFKQFKAGKNPKTGDAFVISPEEIDYWNSWGIANFKLQGVDGGIVALENPGEANEVLRNISKVTNDTVLVISTIVPITDTAVLENATANQHVVLLSTKGGGFEAANVTVPVSDGELLAKIPLGPSNYTIEGNKFFVTQDNGADKVPGGAVIVTDKKNASDVLAALRHFNSTRSTTKSTEGDAGKGLQIPVQMDIDEDLFSLDELATGLEMSPIVIKVTTLENPAVPFGGRNAVGNVTDKVFGLSNLPGGTDENNLFQWTLVPGFGRPRNNIDYPWGDKGKIKATRMQYGFGDHSVEKYAASLKEMRKSGFAMPVFENTSIDFEIVKDPEFESLSDITTEYGTVIKLPAGSAILVSSGKLRQLAVDIGNVADDASYGAGSLQPSLNIDIRNIAVRLTAEDSIKVRKIFINQIKQTPEEASDGVRKFMLNKAAQDLLEAMYKFKFKNTAVDNNNNGRFANAKSFLWYNPNEKAPFKSTMDVGYVPPISQNKARSTINSRSH